LPRGRPVDGERAPFCGPFARRQSKTKRLDPGVTEYRFQIGQMPFGELPETLGK
jgi:hypothetical protein